VWGKGWDEVAANWALDPDVAFLNHGSFGATPLPVLAAQDGWRKRMEREPVEFLWRRLSGRIEEARQRAAGFLDADPSGFAFVPNATTAVSTVLASLDLRAGDRLVATDHAYPAVLNALRTTCDRTGAELVLVGIPLPPPPEDDIVERMLDVVDPRTRLVVVDHVTSSTALILPAADVVAACREAGVPVMVDAAHAPGMLDVSVRRLRPEYWSGNFHKWVCAPKGAAALWVTDELRDLTHPLVTSHGAGQGFAAEFDFQGTDDYTAYLSVPAALDFMASLGWERIRRHNHELAAYGQRVVAGALGTTPPVPEDGFASMALCALPARLAPDQEAARRLQLRLFEDHRIEVPISWWNGAAYIRLSAHVYNAPEDYERLAAVLATLA
jgi:isopenicillin-N epimerase